jgi:hypothetical protein
MGIEIGNHSLKEAEAMLWKRVGVISEYAEAENGRGDELTSLRR